MQNNSTLEHEHEINGISLVESWIVEDKENDKSNMYGMDLPLGSWVGAIKVDNDKIWNEYVEQGLVKGFSIEGYFADRVNMSINDEDAEANDLLNDIKQVLNEVELESYNDYPQGAVNNAKRAIEYKEKNGSSCGTRIGWTRAGQISRKENLTRSTIARMASFKRHEQNKDVPYSEGCGGIMWDAWGGSAGVNWATNKLKEIDGE